MQTLYKISIVALFLSFGALTAEAKSAEWQGTLPTLYSHFIGNTPKDLALPAETEATNDYWDMGITSSGASENLWYPVLKNGGLKVEYTPRVIYTDTGRPVDQANNDNSDIIVPAGTKLTFYYPNFGPKFDEHVWRGVADGTYTQLTGDGNVASAPHVANPGGNWTLWNSGFTPLGTWYPNAALPSNADDKFCDASGMYGYYQGQKDVQHYYPSGDGFHFPPDTMLYESYTEPQSTFLGRYFSAAPYNFKFNQINDNGRQLVDWQIGSMNLDSSHNNRFIQWLAAPVYIGNTIKAKGYFGTLNFRGALTELYEYLYPSFDPPSTTIKFTGTADYTCTNNRTNYTCVINSPGTMKAEYVMSSTFGKLYYSNFAGSAYSAFAAYPFPGCNGPFKVFGSSGNDGAPEYEMKVPEQTVEFNFLVGTGRQRPPLPPGVLKDPFGYINTDYSFKFFSKDPDIGDGISKFDIDWNNDTTIDQSLTENITRDGRGYDNTTTKKQWATRGAQLFKAKAWDNNNNSSDWSGQFTFDIINRAPTKPVITADSSNNKNAGTAEAFTFMSKDPDALDGDRITYTVDWGDGVIETLPGDFASGAVVPAVHTWANGGTYTITVKAKDTYAPNPLESEPSTISITLGANPGSVFDFGLQNTGDLILSPGQSGTNVITISLKSGTTQNVSLSINGLPGDVIPHFSPNACSPQCGSTLTLTAQPNAKNGTYPLVVNGNAAGLGRFTNFTLKVTSDNTKMIADFSAITSAGTRVKSITLPKGGKTKLSSIIKNEAAFPKCSTTGEFKSDPHTPPGNDWRNYTFDSHQFNALGTYTYTLTCNDTQTFAPPDSVVVHVVNKATYEEF